jgi:hypothetical protein
MSAGMSGIIPEKIAVAILPGQMALTLIPRSASSKATAFHVRDSILDSREGAPKQKGDGSVKSVDWNFGYRSTYTPRSRVVHDAIEPAEAFYREIHKRFGIRLTCRVCPVKRHVFAEFLFESFSFFVQEITKDNSSAFLNETPDNACSDSSGAAGNDSNLVVKP